MAERGAATIERFGGLNLVGDPGEIGFSGAIDLLNVEFDKSGRIRQRDGYGQFAAGAAAPYHTLAPFYKTDGTKQLLAAFGGASGALQALSAAGAVVAAQAAALSTYASVARFGGPNAQEAYVAASGAGAATIYKWDGAAWAVPAWVTGANYNTPTGRHLTVSGDNRLVNARRNGQVAGDSPSTVRFSDEGNPISWGRTNYVDVAPGDGEEIVALVAWRELIFAFKSTKFAVFYGVSGDTTGAPIFNFRIVTSQGSAGGAGGAAYRAVAVSPQGVYFANRRGIWITNGGPAELISRDVDALFRGNVGPFGPLAINQAAIDKCGLMWHDERLWFTYPSGASTVNDRVLRFEPATSTWSLYDFPAQSMAAFRITDNDELVFGTPTNISRHSAAYSNDNGVPISSRYRTGFQHLADGAEARLREVILQGSGALGVQASVDWGALDNPVTVPFSPYLGEGRYRKSWRGRNVSLQLCSINGGLWLTNRLQLLVPGSRSLVQK